MCCHSPFPCIRTVPCIRAMHPHRAMHTPCTATSVSPFPWPSCRPPGHHAERSHGMGFCELQEGGGEGGGRQHGSPSCLPTAATQSLQRHMLSATYWKTGTIWQRGRISPCMGVPQTRVHTSSEPASLGPCDDVPRQHAQTTLPQAALMVLFCCAAVGVRCVQQHRRRGSACAGGQGPEQGGDRGL